MISKNINLLIPASVFSGTIWFLEKKVFGNFASPPSASDIIFMETGP